MKNLAPANGASFVPELGISAASSGLSNRDSGEALSRFLPTDSTVVASMRGLVHDAHPHLVTKTGFGLLFPGQSFANDSKASDIPPDSAVLFANVETSAIKWSDGSTMPGTFSAGCFEEGGRAFMDLTLEVGDAQVSWLADAEDEGIWKALESWQHAGKVFIGLNGREQSIILRVPFVLSQCEMRRPYERIDVANQTERDHFFFHFAAQIADSGIMHCVPPRVSEGARLKYVSVTVLLTKRTVQLVDQDVLFRELDSLSAHLRV
ncbi:hypothetical protein P0D75_24980 [Paraburkholderia sediminicola]|uniref:hypothetical protein n=1 Tax=Paraburkholderia sediminicola TaxID=458836 RepID=UPI0038B71972